MTNPHNTDDDPRVVRSRAAVLDAATQLFVERGYRDTSLDDVADVAGVSKRTIHNIYDGKEALFRAALSDILDTAERFAQQVVTPLRDRDDVADALRTTAIELARTVLGGRVVPLRRLLIAEARRFPELAADYYVRAPRRTIVAIADAIRGFRDRGLLDVDDPTLAAEQFAFLVLGASLDRAQFDADGQPGSDVEIERRARTGAELFLRAHGLTTP